MMLTNPSVTVLGTPSRTTPVAAGLQRAGLFAKTVTARAARLSPGSATAAGLAVLAWPPGREPVLESEVYGAGTGALHVWWHTRGAAVGPYVAPGFGPCPACISSGIRKLNERGSSLHLAAWASSWAALQALAVLRHGTSELMGTTWTWQLEEPGLSLITWPWRSGCLTRGCRPHTAR